MFIKVKVKAGAKEDRLIQKGPESYEIHVRERALEGHANRAVLKRLANILGVPVSKLWIAKGAYSSSKIVSVRTPK